MEVNEVIKSLKIPTHVSVILDGNGRWAKKRGKPRTYGHTVGAKNVMQLVEDCDALGIRYLTVYAFSTENWNRPEVEVSVLMRLFKKYLKICYDKAMKNNSKVRIIGDKTGLSEELQGMIRVLEEDTKEHTGIRFNIAINYGSRDEMLRAMQRACADARDGRLAPEDLTAERFADYLDTADIPDPDLMIRTGGEQRLSNWLLWQHAYSEFYFTDVAWPDFHMEDLVEAVRVYTSRDRRFGGLNDSSEPETAETEE